MSIDKKIKRKVDIQFQDLENIDPYILHNTPCIKRGDLLDNRILLRKLIENMSIEYEYYELWDLDTSIVSDLITYIQEKYRLIGISLSVNHEQIVDGLFLAQDLKFRALNLMDERLGFEGLYLKPKMSMIIWLYLFYRGNNYRQITALSQISVISTDRRMRERRNLVTSNS